MPAKTDSSMSETKEASVKTQAPAISVPETQVSPADPTPSSGFMSKLKSRKIFPILGILVLFLLFAGGVYAYQFVYLSPEKIVARSFAKMEEVKTFGFDGKVSVVINSDEAGGGIMPLFSANTFSMGFNGSVDANDPDPKKQKAEMTFDFKMGQAKLIEAQFIGLGETSYINIQDLQGIEATFFGPQGVGLLTPLTNRWIKIDKESLKELQGSAATLESPEVNPEEISKLLEKHKPMTVSQKLPDEEVNGQSMNHYKVDIDKSKLKAFLTDMQELLYKDDLGPNAKESLEEAVEKLEMKDTEIWIGKNDNYLHKVSFGLSQKTDGGSVGVDLAFTMKDFNKSLDIKAPEDAETMEEFSQSLQGLFGAPVLPSSSGSSLNF